jgi:hypothetical protein
MANADLPRGFRPYGELKHVGIYVASGTIYPGDMVKQEGGAAANTTRRRTQVQVATNGAAILGCALNYATVGQSVRVADDPQQLFAAQGDGADYDENADLGTNAGLLATAGDSTFKVSRQEIKTSDIGTSATLELKILGVVEREDGKNAFGANVELICKINNHQLGSGTGTAGV